MEADDQVDMPVSFTFISLPPPGGPEMFLISRVGGGRLVELHSLPVYGYYRILHRMDSLQQLEISTVPSFIFFGLISFKIDLSIYPPGYFSQPSTA